MDCQGKNSPQTPLYSRPPWNTDGKPPAFGVGQRFPPNSCSADPANAIRLSSGIEVAVSTATQLCVPYEKTSGSVSRTVPSRRPWPRKHCDRYTQVTERTNPRQPIHSFSLYRHTKKQHFVSSVCGETLLTLLRSGDRPSTLRFTHTHTHLFHDD